ncbi:MAG: hypothetical protein AB4426_15010 [Xenococcaceae cyanobacterium]
MRVIAAIASVISPLTCEILYLEALCQKLQFPRWTRFKTGRSLQRSPQTKYNVKKPSKLASANLVGELGKPWVLGLLSFAEDKSLRGQEVSFMETKIIWQQNSSYPDNADNFATISQWWENLNGQEIAFAQRLIPTSGNLDEIDWESQRFDEKFALQMPQIRGITLYWQKPDSEEERNITADKLELDTARQQLYIYPQSQPQLVIRVGIPEIIYQTIELKDPQIAGTSVGENCILLLRDRQQQLEVKLTLSRKSLGQLLENLPG